MSGNGELHTMSRSELQREYLRGRLMEAEGRALKTSAREEIVRRFPRPKKPAEAKGTAGAAVANRK